MRRVFNIFQIKSTNQTEFIYIFFARNFRSGLDNVKERMTGPFSALFVSTDSGSLLINRLEGVSLPRK